MLTASLLLLLALASHSFPQSLVEKSLYSNGDQSKSCLKRSVYVYTLDSSTYVVTNLGSTNLAATPTFCLNQTITATEPASTVIIYQQSTASATPPSDTIVADNGFEDGNASPFNSSAPGLQVTAQVIQGGPLRPYSGKNYL